MTMKLPAPDKAPSALLTSTIVLALLAFCAGNAAGSEMVYVPLNPSFGGNPLNNSLFNSANAQNKHKDPDAGLGAGGLNQTPLKQFNDILERSILGQLASAATSSVIGAGGKLVPGSVQTGNFLITISDLGGGLLRVTTTDKVTGATSTFEVGQ
jgi:curli production assembly/transport component CsgF